MDEVEVTSSPNIALIKYWGKRDVSLNLPLNGSISATLEHPSLKTKTIVRCSDNSSSDSFTLNGERSEITPRVALVLSKIRKMATRNSSTSLEIISENNFPTAAGMASSASGFAALTVGLCNFFGIQHSSAEIGAITRQGSGSACRSLYGGFVIWDAGIQSNGKDSIARQLFVEDHWPQLRIIILTVQGERKKVSSTSGMQRTVATSQLMEARQLHIDSRLNDMEKAIKNRDFNTLAEITMRDSNQFHSLCLDSYPPIHYLNDNSREVMSLIHDLNEENGRNIAAYTFDAGPNAMIFVEEENVIAVCQRISSKFHVRRGDEAWRTCSRGAGGNSNSSAKKTIENIIIARIGGGPVTP